MEKAFSGHLFVLGRADQCSASGNNQDTLNLLVPLPEIDSAINKCQVQIVKGIGQINRSFNFKHLFQENRNYISIFFHILYLFSFILAVLISKAYYYYSKLNS